jgi:hypothetical protein
MGTNEYSEYQCCIRRAERGARVDTLRGDGLHARHGDHRGNYGESGCWGSSNGPCFSSLCESPCHQVAPTVNSTVPIAMALLCRLLLHQSEWHRNV